LPDHIQNSRIDGIHPHAPRGPPTARNYELGACAPCSVLLPERLCHLFSWFHG
jgi:hypothetical protein